MLDFADVSMPFDVSDLVSSGGALLGLVAPFVLLGLTFIFVPMVIYLIRIALNTRADNRLNADKTRDQYTFRQALKEDLRENKLSRFRK